MRTYNTLEPSLLCAEIFILMHYRHFEFVSSLIVHKSFYFEKQMYFSYSLLSVQVFLIYWSYLFLILLCWFSLIIHIKLALIKKCIRIKLWGILTKNPLMTKDWTHVMILVSEIFSRKSISKNWVNFCIFFRGLRIIQFLFERPRVYQIGGTCLKQMYYSTLRLLKRLWKKVS